MHSSEVEKNVKSEVLDPEIINVEKKSESVQSSLHTSDILSEISQQTGNKDIDKKKNLLLQTCRL